MEKGEEELTFEFYGPKKGLNGLNQKAALLIEMVTLMILSKNTSDKAPNQITKVP